MIQNVKNFLIAFLAGLIIFGACAVFVLYTTRNGANKSYNSDKDVYVPSESSNEEFLSGTYSSNAGESTQISDFKISN